MADHEYEWVQVRTNMWDLRMDGVPVFFLFRAPPDCKAWRAYGCHHLGVSQLFDLRWLSFDEAREHVLAVAEEMYAKIPRLALGYSKSK